VSASSRQGIVIAVVLAVAIVAALQRLSAGADHGPVEAGLSFEEVSFSSSRLGGALTAADHRLIQAVALAEIEHAFRGLRLKVLPGRARYQIRVAQTVLDRRMQRETGVAGQARGMSGFGGSGEVSFSFIANAAMVYVGPEATRDELVEAIGRGIGRAAVHEFTHQLLPRAPIHATTDVASYEYRSAARPQQFVGEMRWDLARPLLEARLGR
jgi:hypothetical protein